MSFVPLPARDLTPVQVTIQLPASIHSIFEDVGSRCGLSVAETIQQFCQWGISEEHLKRDAKSRGKWSNKNKNQDFDHDRSES